MKGWDLAVCSVMAISFNRNNTIMQREKSRHDRRDKMEMNPHYLAEERATAAASASLLSKGAFHPSAHRVGRGKEGRREKRVPFRSAAEQ